MKTFQHVSLLLLAMTGLAVSTGCSSNPSSTAANNNPQMLRVLDTKVLGKPAWASQQDNVAVVQMNDGALPANYVVVGLDQNRQITSVMETTHYASHNFQGVKVLSGNLGNDDDVALPGGEYDVAVQDNIKNYLIQRNTASNSKAPAGTANSSTVLASQ